MADNTQPAPVNPVLRSSTPTENFLKFANQGEVWVHEDLGKCKIAGVIRERDGKLVSVQLIPLQPEGFDITNVEAFAAKIERKHVTEKRKPRKYVRYDPSKRAA